jgi:choice-of-anchor A domain-containing protein
MKNILLTITIAFSWLTAVSAVCYADTATFGVASAYNLVALGYGSTAGNIGTTADVEGRIAAANQITQATTIGSTLGSDPYGSLANDYAMVAGTGITATNYFNVNGGGNVYTPANSASYNWNESPKGSLVTTGSDPINFAGLRTTLDAQSLQLGTLTPNGTVTLGTGSNPSWLVLNGTSKTLNVFTLTSAQFASANNPLDIQVPAGSTVVINVQGTNVTLGTSIYFNGQEETDSNDDQNMILFNFPDASTVAINGQLDGAVLAPFATLTGSSQMGGNIIAAAIGQTGEVHNDEFGGTLPSPPSPPPTATPEPGTLALMGTGLLFMAGWLARRGRRSQA